MYNYKKKFSEAPPPGYDPATGNTDNKQPFGQSCVAYENTRYLDAGKKLFGLTCLHLFWLTKYWTSFIVYLGSLNYFGGLSSVDVSWVVECHQQNGKYGIIWVGNIRGK